MKKRTLLIVDDQPVNRKILIKMLQDEYDILEAGNGIEALALLQRHSDEISAMLLDIVMPVMDGYAVLERMAEDDVLSKIPVIVSSQKEGDDNEVRALSLGAQDFIPKPYKADIIRHRLSNTIRLRETASTINRMEKDAVTGLYNKQFFLDKVEEALAKNPEQKYDLLCIGINRFQLIFDTYGQKKSDELLRYAGTILQEANPEKPLCSRFENNLFYLLLPHKARYDDDFFALWEKKLNQFQIDMDIRAYCGVYTIEDRTLPAGTMCSHAELAANRNQGKYDSHFSLYDASLRDKLLEEQFITSNMQSALEQHQFVVYYQPKYDLENEYIAGAEALVRWIHPEKGFMSPGLFIPLFERNGFITQLDQYVWESACRDLRNWMDKGIAPVAVSVNISRADIYNPKLTDILLDLIAKYEIPIRYLHLEITESAYTTNPDQIIVVVNRLRELGFIVEMDDFGSGYSSLNMLADMPVDVLKLDMRFIQSETGKTSGKGILSFVISLAKWLDLAVVAEGVETSEQISILRSMECNYVQGFYYAKPMKKEEFEHLLSSSATTEMRSSGKSVNRLLSAEVAKTADENAKVILIVDDIDINRAVLASAFMDEFRIVEKENGSTAWAYLQENADQVEVILLDLLMPVMDGFQLLSKIRADKQMKKIPVIITSQGDKDTEQRALSMQADDFIAKPYNTDIIRHRVHNVIASYRLKQLEEQAKGAALTVHHSMEELTENKTAWDMVHALKPHFDIVRLVDANHTLVHSEEAEDECDIHSCFSVWGKTTRCNNCISFEALKNKTRLCKMEYSETGLYFVISEYVPYGKDGAVIEMVTKLPDRYVDNVFDKKMLYVHMDAINNQLDHDELTGVFNRRYINLHLNDYINTARSQHQELNLAMVDVDGFKKLNDTHGHLLGDQVLKAISRTLSGNVEEQRGDFVARFGGDEFLLVCRGDSPADFVKRVRGISKIINHIPISQKEELAVGISAGCVSFSECSDCDATALIDRADKRLYHAKQSGRGRVVASD